MMMMMMMMRRRRRRRRRRREYICPCPKSYSDSSVVQHVAWSLTDQAIFILNYGFIQRVF
jgi:hypothetical protein